MPHNELPRDPVAAPTTSAVHHDLFIFWNPIKMLSHRILRDELATDVADIPLMGLSHIKKEEILTSVHAGL